MEDKSKKAGTADPKEVAKTLRENTFDTVLGTIGFDGNGDITGYDSFVWYRWTADCPVQADPHSSDEG